MLPDWDEYAKGVELQLDGLRSDLKDLESGRVTHAEHNADGLWKDVTDERATYIRTVIQTRAQILNSIGKRKVDNLWRS